MTHQGRQSWGLTIYPNTNKQLNLTDPKPRKLQTTDCVAGQVEWGERA